jgi:hypothetical protein
MRPLKTSKHVVILAGNLKRFSGISPAGEISNAGVWNQASHRGLVPQKIWVKNKISECSELKSISDFTINSSNWSVCGSSWLSMLVALN